MTAHVIDYPKLRRQVDAHPYPLVFAETRDEARLLELVREEAGRRGTPVWLWSAASGLARDGHGPARRPREDFFCT